jgi:hypothetical protein
MHFWIAWHELIKHPLSYAKGVGYPPFLACRFARAWDGSHAAFRRMCGEFPAHSISSARPDRWLAILFAIAGGDSFLPPHAGN